MRRDQLKGAVSTVACMWSEILILCTMIPVRIHVSPTRLHPGFTCSRDTPFGRKPWLLGSPGQSISYISPSEQITYTLADNRSICIVVRPTALRSASSFVRMPRGHVNPALLNRTCLTNFRIPANTTSRNIHAPANRIICNICGRL